MDVLPSSYPQGVASNAREWFNKAVLESTVTAVGERREQLSFRIGWHHSREKSAVLAGPFLIGGHTRVRPPTWGRAIGRSYSVPQPNRRLRPLLLSNATDVTHRTIRVGRPFILEPAAVVGAAAVSADASLL